jgi:hypothetical protein
MSIELTQKQSKEMSTLSDRMAALRQRATQAPEAWNPEPGDSLIGILIGTQKASGVYGENYQILIQDERGSVTAAWLTVWLKENLRAQGAETGDLIALSFLGKKQSPAGRFYNAYSLIVEKV